MLNIFIKLWVCWKCCKFVCTKATQMPKEGNKGFTFSIPIEDHADYKKECVQNDDDMSETINKFMNAYTKASRNARIKNTLKPNE